MGRVRVGISGWSYRAWRGDFYPQGLRQRDELAYAAQRMTSVEVNGSFYSLQRPTSYASWRDAVPDDFAIAVKGGRFVTHLKRLREPEAGLANFFASGVLALGEKLGPVLWQLPERIDFDEGLLTTFFDALPRTIGETVALAERRDPQRLPDERTVLTSDLPAERPVRHVMEYRHRSFTTPGAVELLRAHDVGTVIADSAGRWVVADAVTSRDVYVRLHGHTELYTSGYSGASLDRWAQRCRAWVDDGRDVWVYFDNDARGRAPWDAVALLERLGWAGP